MTTSLENGSRSQATKYWAMFKNVQMFVHSQSRSLKKNVQGLSGAIAPWNIFFPCAFWIR